VPFSPPLIACAALNPELKITGQIDQGDDLKSVIGQGDVVIDFSFHSATAGIAELCATHKKALVIGTTGHAESVQVTFDPARISYATLLKIFFSVAHDPTQLNRQGPDVGTQYRSSLFYMSDEQKKTAQAYIEELNKAHVFPRPIVTEVVKYKAFYPAEAYHQDYAELHPDEPYIAINDAPKVVNLRKQFPELYKDAIH